MDKNAEKDRKRDRTLGKRSVFACFSNQNVAFGQLHSVQRVVFFFLLLFSGLRTGAAVIQACLAGLLLKQQPTLEQPGNLTSFDNKIVKSSYVPNSHLRS